MANIFIDGSAGTTGLRIAERLCERKDLKVHVLNEKVRKDPDARRAAINEADVVFLCLPDAAAREAVSFLQNPDTVLIDTSTAHRTEAGWCYGFPELSSKREEIRTSRRIANPGCHASGFVALVAPLREAGLLRSDARLSCFSLTGYSGGGKSMIGLYESSERPALLNAPRMYGLGQEHKHLKEMKALCSLASEPVFCPIVADFYSGMEVVVPLTPAVCAASLEKISSVYAAYYKSGVVRFVPEASEDGFLSANALSGRDDMEIAVFGNPERILLVARFDNLGKGASGAAIQNMNLVLGLEETAGLVIG